MSTILSIMKEQDTPTLFDIMTENPNMIYNEAIKVQEELRLKKKAGSCITSGIKRDRDAMDKMKKRAQEAEGELSILKGIESNRVKELEKRIRELMDRVETLEKDLGKRTVTG